jgi:hypothetical protein
MSGGSDEQKLDQQAAREPEIQANGSDGVAEQAKTDGARESSSGSDDPATEKSATAGQQSAQQQQPKPDEASKKPSKLKQAWAKLGLDL